MNTATASDLAAKIGALQIELEALGFALDSRGSREAADVAMATSARLVELRADYEAGFFPMDPVGNTPDGSLDLRETIS